MLCQNCGKNEATTHIKQVINGDTAERHLCSECAEHLGYGDAFSGFGFDVAGLFGNFFGDAVHSLGAPRKVVRCPKCGSSFNDIVREGRVGCAECYKVFYNELKPSLQRIHGQIRHSGKIASTAEPVSEEEAKIDEKEELKKQMDEAVAVQNFELSFRSLYDSVQSYASALNAAKVSLECERSDLAAAQLRYEQGTISENALHTAEDELYTAQDTVSGAERDLFTAYNNYRWAVDYGLLAG